MVVKNLKSMIIPILFVLHFITYAYVNIFSGAISSYYNTIMETANFKTGNNTITQLTVIKGKDEKKIYFQPDLHFAERLRTAQKYNDRPLVNDIIVKTYNNESVVNVIINNGNTMNEYRHLRNVSVELLIGKKKYQNKLPSVIERPIRLLKYVASELPDSGTVSLYDHSTSFIYEKLPYLSLSTSPKRKIAICAYISEYNSIYEIKSFLAYYLLQKVDCVIFYCVVNYDIFLKELKFEIDNGYVVLYHFPWPLTRAYGPIQNAVKVSHINSCYYRHRHYFEYIISQDVDEYVYSEEYPFDLYRACKYNSMIHHPFKVFAVDSYFYYKL